MQKKESDSLRKDREDKALRHLTGLSVKELDLKTLLWIGGEGLMFICFCEQMLKLPLDEIVYFCCVYERQVDVSGHETLFSCISVSLYSVRSETPLKNSVNKSLCLFAVMDLMDKILSFCS